MNCNPSFFVNVFLKKENKDLSNLTARKTQTPLTPNNPSEKLLENLKDARSCLELLKGTVLKTGISDSFLKEIRNLQRKQNGTSEILQTMRLQLEQSLRERRYLTVENLLLKKQTEGQNIGGMDRVNLRKNIREIIENEIKCKKNIDVSLSSSLNVNML